MILISKNENFANVVIESLSVGTPVLLSEEVGLSAYVKENGLGWVCQSSAIDLSKAIVSIAENKLDSNRIREAAPQIIARDFEDKILIDRYLSFYNSVLTSS